MQSAMVESVTALDISGEVLSSSAAATVAADMRGKHRMVAGLKRLEQEAKSLQEELEELEKTENVSAICKELLWNIEANPDALLPVTKGPADPLWDRWFEGLPDSRGCSCWIL